MIKLLVFVLFAFLCAALKNTPSMSNALRSRVLVEFKNAMVPVISSQLKHIVLETISGKERHIRYTIFDINIYVNPIDPQQIDVQFVGGSTLRLTGHSIGMQGGAIVKARRRIIKKRLRVSFGVSDVSFSIYVGLKTVNGKLNIEVHGFDVNIAEHNVNFKVSGGIIGKIANSIANSMKGHVVRSVVNQVKSKVPNLVTARVNKMLNDLPESIPVAEGLYMKYQFPEAPVIEDDFLVTHIVAYLHSEYDVAPPSIPVTSVPEFDRENPKGVQFFVSDYVVKSALHALFRLKKLIRIERMVRDHLIAMNCSLNELPDFRFHNAINASASVTCDIVIDNNTNSHLQVSADFEMALVASVRKAIVYFAIDKFSISKLNFKVLSFLNFDWFRRAVNEVVAGSIGVVNAQLGREGIPLPAIKGIDYNETSQYIGDGYTMISMNPVFNIKMDGAESLPEIPEATEVPKSTEDEDDDEDEYEETDDIEDDS